jgi:hypothetical protein
MKQLFLTIALLLSINLYSQDWNEISADSITDVQFAANFFDINLPNKFKLKVNPSGFLTHNSGAHLSPANPNFNITRLSMNMGGFDILNDLDTSLNISIYSLIGGRWTTIPDSALYAESINITYHLEKEHWFVVSGIDKETGRLIYIKVYWGDTYISILRIHYPKEKRSLIEPYIPQLSQSFVGF